MSQHQTFSHPSLLVSSFLNDLATHFDGDIDISEATRQVFSTDNSIYQRMPQAVVFPQHTDDLISITQLATKAHYQKIILTARGGGTGTNGQSLTDGIIIDLSRHMNHILAIDPVARTATVQAGVVKDQLNAALKEHGLFFAPELSTSNRATIGGMINTDASGQGSCRYGKTHHHVLALKTVLLGGEVLTSTPLSKETWQTDIADKSPEQQAIYHTLYEIADQHQDTITSSFPKLNRSLTGYDLPSLLTGDIFNINSVLCGSEGSLGFITEATLNLLPIPQHRLLINIGYAGFQEALRDANALMTHHPLSIETVDSKVLGLAKKDIVWNNVAQYFPETQIAIAGINLVELTADTEEELLEQKKRFLAHLQEDQSVTRLSCTVAFGSTEINHVYAMRKRSVGLLGNVLGEKRPQPFVEDTAVPPENLADYIAQFRAFLDSMQLDYGMFGHVDAGVLHVRPLIDMKAPDAAHLITTISNKVVELTHHFGGVLWGEHGKGLRSSYAPTFFGKAYPLVQQVKAAFDPFNQLNPGKIATPSTQPEAQLTPLTQVTFRGLNDQQVSQKDWGVFGNAMHCNGNGACFNYDLNDPMCPSYKVTRDRVHSPKGRATLVKEWLRRENQHESSDTFDQEVYDALHGCLSCKSCSGQCPVKVDIPEAKARFLQRYHLRHRRSLRDYVIGHMEQTIPYLLPVAQLYNKLMSSQLIQSVQKRVLGLVDTPLFHKQADIKWEALGAVLLNKELSNIPSHQNTILLVQDAFTRYFDTEVLIDCITLLKRLGITPCVLPYFPNGKPLHVHGFLKQFEQVSSKNIALLNRAAATGLPLIGLDPAMTLVYRQEYLQCYEKRNNDALYKVQMLQEWLSDWIETQDKKIDQDQVFYLANHCTERTQSPASTKQWQSIFAHFGIALKPLALGCCGMSGTYGHEAEHQNTSKNIYAQSWQEKIKTYDDKVLVTGYSCRCQVKRTDHKKQLHPVQVLLKFLPE